jgi:predicted ATP-dependent serine protease
VRAFKNRFGAVNELGVFAMTEKGLKGVSNPSALFLSQQLLVVQMLVNLPYSIVLQKVEKRLLMTLAA